MRDLVIFLLVLSSGIVSSQNIQVMVDVQLPFPTEIGQLEDASQAYSATLINSVFTQQNVYMLATLAGDNGVSISIDENYLPPTPLVLDGGESVTLTTQEISELNSTLGADGFIIEGVSDLQLILGSIPEGNYTLCVTVYDYNTRQQIGNGCSIVFPIGNGNIPTIISPYWEEIVMASEIPSFPIIWEYPLNVGYDQSDMKYIVKIIDITANYDWDIEELFNDAGIPVVIEKEVFTVTNYFYNQEADDPELIVGHEYGVRIQAIDQNNILGFDNGKFSEVRRFYYGEMPDVFGDEGDGSTQADETPSDCESRCNPPLIENNNFVASIDSLESIKIGHFYLLDYQLTENDNKYSGTAKVQLDFLNNVKINVQVKDIKINELGQVFEGTVRAIQDDTGDLAALAQYINFPIADGMIDQGLNYVPEQYSNMLAPYLQYSRNIYAFAASSDIGLPIGFEQSLMGNKFIMGLTDFILTPTGAKAKVAIGAKLSIFDGDNMFMMIADSVCIHPVGFGGDFMIQLQQDLNFPNDNNNAFELVLKGSSGNANSCKIQFNCQGLQSFQLAGELNFPRSVIRPYDQQDGDESKAKATFVIDLANNLQDTSSQSSTDTSGGYFYQTGGNNSVWGKVNWMAQVNMNSFEITGLKGWRFDITDAFIDMSDLANPDNIDFPDGYHTTTNDYRGFYLREASITPPPHILLDSTYAIVRNLLIEPALYANILVENILPIEKGNLGGFGISIDTLQLDFYDNTLEYGMMTGDMTLPFAGDSSLLKYTALIFNTAAYDEPDPNFIYAFDVTVMQQLEFPFLIADATIADDSYLEVVFMPGSNEQPYIKTLLHGTLSIDTELNYPSGLPELPADIKLAEMEFQIDYTSGSIGFDSDNTYLAFASPQKKVGSFPISMDNFDVALDAEAETVAVQFSIGLSMGMDELDLSAGATFSLVSNIESMEVLTGIMDNGVGGAFNVAKKIRLDRVTFDSINIGLVKENFSILGKIMFYNNPIEGGGRDKGAKGSLSVTLPIAGIFGRLSAIFGTYGTPPEVPPGQNFAYSENFYPYWYVDGIIGSEAAIPICAGVGIYGFGGGVGYNIIQTASYTIIDGEISGEPEYTPTYNSFMIRAGIMLGTMPTPTAFNADITFTAQFVNGGLDMMSLTGDGYVMTPINERNDPQLYVGVALAFYTQNDTRDWYMDGSLKVAANIGDGTFVGNMQNPVIPNQMVNGIFYASADTWYFYMGAPDFDPYDSDDPRGSALLTLENILEANFKLYMMVGHGVPTSLPPLPLEVQNILNNPSGDLDGTTSATNVNAQGGGVDYESGAGFSHGAYGSLNASIDARIIYAALSVYLGYDMNITKQDVTCANTGRAKGINGWYAEGQAYAGLEGSVGVRIKVFGVEQKFNLFSLAAAIALSGGAPSPSYFHGQAAVYFSLLGGKLEGSSSFNLSVGERCSPVSNDPLAGIDFFEHIDPSQDERDVIPSARVLTRFVLPMGEDIVIPTPIFDTDGEVTNVVNYKYRPEISYTLKEDFGSKNTVSCQPIRWLNEDVHDAMVVRPVQMLQQNRYYTINMKVQAWDLQTNNWLRVDNRIWSQDTIVRFKTGSWPPDLYEFVQYTVPLPFERFYLQNELNLGKVYFTQALPQDHYFPATSLFGGQPMQYKIRFTKLDDQSVTDVNFTNNSGGSNPHLSFAMPTLENEAIYAMQIIRKNPNMLTAVALRNTLDILNTEDELLQANLTLIPPGEQIEGNEFLLYHTYFRTSKFNTLKAKMQAASLQGTQYTHINSSYGNKLNVNMTINEGFEQRDFQNFYPGISQNEDLLFEPRIRVLDLFNKTYHDNKAEPKIWGFQDYYENTVQGGFFNWDWPQDLKLEWSQNMVHRIKKQNIDTNLKPPLTEGEISALWQNYMSTGNLTSVNYYFNTGMFGNINFLDGSGPSSNFTVKYDVHHEIGKDKEVVYNWAMDYLARSLPFQPYNYQAYFQMVQPAFIQKKNQLNNTNFKLQNNTGSYNLKFSRNISHVPGEELFNIFTMYSLDFNTPGLIVTGGK
ncbi:MAG: hypothetical protein KBD43_06160 [Saprospiraceae bacterium]|jgi:hypothetical protein|nr:hypothetical protein [Saprospiraceae bacterium]MBP9124247.1 hypothetical protein [Saprospiraceae bacterium]MBP9845617.1 hypothetical protein [Saprospiraceae bacterium]